MTTIAGNPSDVSPGAERPDDGPARWTRLATVGLLMAAAGPLLMLAAALIWGLDDDLGFIVASAVVGLAAAALMRSARTWMKVVALVLALLLAAMLFWTMFGLAAPASFFDFVPGVLVVPGVLIALVAGVASIRARRRGATGTAVGEQRAIRGAVAAVAGLAAISAVVSIASRETVSDTDAQAADLVVDLKDFAFDQDAYELQGGDTVLVKNSDPFLHTFTIDALGIDVTLNGGSEKLVSIPAEPGTYVLYCEPHTGDKEEPAADDMAARITVS